MDCEDNGNNKYMYIVMNGDSHGLDSTITINHLSHDCAAYRRC